MQAIAAQCNRNGLLTRQSRNCQLLLALEGKFCVHSREKNNHIIIYTVIYIITSRWNIDQSCHRSKGPAMWDGNRKSDSSSSKPDGVALVHTEKWIKDRQQG